MQNVQIVLEHPFLEYLSWIATVIIACTAVLGGFLAWSQLREMSEYRNSRIRILNATLLMELDKRWDSPEMNEARVAWTKIRDEIDHATGVEHPMANDQQKLQRVREAWTEMLSQKRKDDGTGYVQLIGIAGFFETVGLMVRRGYIHQDDVVTLFRQPILAVERCFRGHIEERSKEMGMPKGLFEHALYLAELAQRG